MGFPANLSPVDGRHREAHQTVSAHGAALAGGVTHPNLGSFTTAAMSTAMHMGMGSRCGARIVTVTVRTMDGCNITENCAHIYCTSFQVTSTYDASWVQLSGAYGGSIKKERNVNGNGEGNSYS